MSSEGELLHFVGLREGACERHLRLTGCCSTEQGQLSGELIDILSGRPTCVHYNLAR